MYIIFKNVFSELFLSDTSLNGFKIDIIPI